MINDYTGFRGSEEISFQSKCNVLLSIPTSSWIQAKIISTLRCCPRRFVCLYNFNIPKADFLVQDTLKIVACDDDGGELKEVTVNLIKEV